jgi:hypothetical protein
MTLVVPPKPHISLIGALAPAKPASGNHSSALTVLGNQAAEKTNLWFCFEGARL